MCDGWRYRVGRAIEAAYTMSDGWSFFRPAYRVLWHESARSIRGDPRLGVFFLADLEPPIRIVDGLVRVFRHDGGQSGWARIRTPEYDNELHPL